MQKPRPLLRVHSDKSSNKPCSLLYSTLDLIKVGLRKLVYILALLYSATFHLGLFSETVSLHPDLFFYPGQLELLSLSAFAAMMDICRVKKQLESKWHNLSPKSSLYASLRSHAVSQ